MGVKDDSKFRLCFTKLGSEEYSTNEGANPLRAFIQCCGSGSTCIRIHLVVLDPVPNWECGSGSRSMEISQILQINLGFCLSKRLSYFRRYVFWLLTYSKSIFHVKVQLFVTQKSDQDPHWFCFLDPDPHWKFETNADPHQYCHRCFKIFRILLVVPTNHLQPWPIEDIKERNTAFLCWSLTDLMKDYAKYMIVAILESTHRP